MTRKDKMSERERSELLDDRLIRLQQAIAQIQPTQQMYQSLDELVLNIKQIHQEDSARIEKLVDEFREKRLWSYKEQSDG